MGKWWRSYKVSAPIVLRPCGNVYIIFNTHMDLNLGPVGEDFADIVYICDEPDGHKGMHIDKVERKAWRTPELRLRTTGNFSGGQS